MCHLGVHALLGRRGFFLNIYYGDQIYIMGLCDGFWYKSTYCITGFIIVHCSFLDSFPLFFFILLNSDHLCIFFCGDHILQRHTIHAGERVVTGSKFNTNVKEIIRLFSWLNGHLSLICRRIFNGQGIPQLSISGLKTYYQYIEFIDVISFQMVKQRCEERLHETPSSCEA